MITILYVHMNLFVIGIKKKTILFQFKRKRNITHIDFIILIFIIYINFFNYIKIMEILTVEELGVGKLENH